MNTTEFTLISEAEDVQSKADENSNGPRQAARRARREAWLRYALIAGIALLSAWLTISVRGSLKEIDEQVDMIRANLVASPL